MNTGDVIFFDFDIVNNESIYIFAPVLNANSSRRTGHRDTESLRKNRRKHLRGLPPCNGRAG